MTTLPPIPSWDSLHPLIVHFPVALLLVAPIFVLAGAMMPRSRRTFFISALVLMLLGTLGTYLAVGTGEAGAELADRTDAINAAIQHHEDLAETTRTVFTALTCIFAVIVVVPRFMKGDGGKSAATILPLAFLLFYAAGMLLLANTAHQGGRLVHEFGVRAMIAQGGPAVATDASIPPVPREAEDD